VAASDRQAIIADSPTASDTAIKIPANLGIVRTMFSSCDVSFGAWPFTD
jgi:hypothetical protein